MTLPAGQKVESHPGERLCRNEESVLNLLGLLDDFNRASPKGRAVIYEQVSTKAVLEPTSANRLALAMLKAMPGHHGYNLESAETLLNAVLDDSNMLSAGVLHFARTYARSVSEQRKLAQINQQLKEQLTDARNKLEALTEIERDVDLTVPKIEEPEPDSSKSNINPAQQHGESQKNSASR